MNIGEREETKDAWGQKEVKSVENGRNEAGMVNGRNDKYVGLTEGRKVECVRDKKRA